MLQCLEVELELLYEVNSNLSFHGSGHLVIVNISKLAPFSSIDFSALRSWLAAKTSVLENFVW